MAIKPHDLDALIQLFESSDWDEMHLRIDDVEVFLSTDPNAKTPNSSPLPLQVVTSPGTIADIGSALPLPNKIGSSGFNAEQAPQTTLLANWLAVTAPTLGTFYRAAKPGSPSFVEIGQAVEADTEICLIEVMKLFTTLKAGVKGTIKQVCVKDSAMVEFGEILFYIEPT
jgi:acetyl-CoA carboxylase biotin carboxyl carrier protein